MEQKYYITHHGVKGQKWGVRRYQHKDGSLTLMGRRRIKKTEKEEAAKAKQKAKDQKAQAKSQKAQTKQAEKDQKEQETVEQKRARLLKSANAKELYENRNLLTTQEINERLTRIDTERRLGEVASKGEKSRFDKLTERMDKIVKVGTKVNDMYKLTESGAGKALKEAIFGKKSDDDNDARNLLGKSVDALSTKQLTTLETYLQKKKSVNNLREEMKGSKKSKTLDEITDIMTDKGKLGNLSVKELEEIKNTVQTHSQINRLLNQLI